MKITLEMKSLLPGADWQRLETWAALAGMTPAEYVRACVRLGHSKLSADLRRSTIGLSPNVDAHPVD
ncbi:MAG: hypothetical protein OXR84_06595 [Magnetovibrio sp.]|nr:hypothetical protein [Magnetovibrio sp.]